MTGCYFPRTEGAGLLGYCGPLRPTGVCRRFAHLLLVDSAALGPAVTGPIHGISWVRGLLPILFPTYYFQRFLFPRSLIVTLWIFSSSMRLRLMTQYVIFVTDVVMCGQAPRLPRNLACPRQID